MLAVVLRLRSVSLITTSRFQPAATPVLLLSSKRGRFRSSSPHRTKPHLASRIVGTISPVAYRSDLPTTGRRRTSPVMTQDLFLQGTTRSTRTGSPPVTVFPATREVSGGLPSASSKGGAWHTRQAEVPPPGVSLPGPIVTLPSPDLPLGPPWLRTSNDTCRVRAESSVRVRTRTGRLWQTNRSPPFLCLTVCYQRRLGPEPLRLTRPDRALASE